MVISSIRKQKQQQQQKPWRQLESVWQFIELHTNMLLQQQNYYHSSKSKSNNQFDGVVWLNWESYDFHIGRIERDVTKIKWNEEFITKRQARAKWNQWKWLGKMCLGKSSRARFLNNITYLINTDGILWWFGLERNVMGGRMLIRYHELLAIDNKNPRNK